MKTVVFTDTMTGRRLEIQFDLDADRMTINDIEVVRRRDLEREGEFVYSSPEKDPRGSKLYPLNENQIKRMRDLWAEEG